MNGGKLKLFPTSFG